MTFQKGHKEWQKRRNIMEETTEAKVSNDARPDRSKPVRTPLGTRNRLTFKGLDPDYVYRVINDKDDRLKRAQDGGYEFVESQDQLGDKMVAEATKMGSNVSKPVGHGVTGYLMRIKRDWYVEDQKTKQEQVNRTEQTMKPDKSKEEYGSGLTSE
jgi:hypothetical protein